MARIVDLTERLRTKALKGYVNAQELYRTGWLAEGDYLARREAFYAFECTQSWLREANREAAMRRIALWGV